MPGGGRCWLSHLLLLRLQSPGRPRRRLGRGCCRLGIGLTCRRRRRLHRWRCRILLFVGLGCRRCFLGLGLVVAAGMGAAQDGLHERAQRAGLLARFGGLLLQGGNARVDARFGGLLILLQGCNARVADVGALV